MPLRWQALNVQMLPVVGLAQANQFISYSTAGYDESIFVHVNARAAQASLKVRSAIRTR